MDIPVDFRFADNPIVHTFAEDRAALIFGKDWKNREDLELSHPSKTCHMVAGEHCEWSLYVDIHETLGHVAVACKKNGMNEDPIPNTAAVFQFNNVGERRSTLHCSKGRVINPPNGMPALVAIKEDGSLGDCWYVNASGSYSTPATKKEIDRRVAAAKRSTATKLCFDSSDIIALQGGSQSQGDRSQSGAVLIGHRTEVI